MYFVIVVKKNSIAYLLFYLNSMLSKLGRQATSLFSIGSPHQCGFVLLFLFFFNDCDKVLTKLGQSLQFSRVDQQLWCYLNCYVLSKVNRSQRKDSICMDDYLLAMCFDDVQTSSSMYKLSIFCMVNLSGQKAILAQLI